MGIMLRMHDLDATKQLVRNFPCIILVNSRAALLEMIKQRPMFKILHGQIVVHAIIIPAVKFSKMRSVLASNQHSSIKLELCKRTT